VTARTKAVERITEELKPFDAADFRATEVRDRASESDDAVADEEDADAEKPT
jgi:hypothetical protein